ncbi:MAG: hypothetical protein JWM74_3331 [Myxococcaceae bacterium]|nr:hypothetical protein [Myxococcaceae bacterium]
MTIGGGSFASRALLLLALGSTVGGSILFVLASCRAPAAEGTDGRLLALERRVAELEAEKHSVDGSSRTRTDARMSAAEPSSVPPQSGPMFAGADGNHMRAPLDHLEDCQLQPSDAAWAFKGIAAIRADLALIAREKLADAHEAVAVDCRTSCCVTTLRWKEPAKRTGSHYLDHLSNCLQVARLQASTPGDETIVTDCGAALARGELVKPALVDRGKRAAPLRFWAYTPWDHGDGGIFPVYAAASPSASTVRP